MGSSYEAKAEFRFCTSLSILELTGRRASDLAELLKHILEVDGSVIFNHTHHFIQEMGFLVSQPPSDFAHWVGEVLGDRTLAEKLAGVDPCQFGSIRELREAIAGVIERRLETGARSRTARPGEDFHFLRTVSLAVPTPYVAWNLYEFSEALKRVSTASLAHHFFDARLRLDHQSDDFSNWIRHSVALPEMASQLERLSPYTCTLEGLRQDILHIVDATIYRNVRRVGS